ncbi:YkuJ family protein [Liquorilactobacillus capillatus]|nr:YkuJ family protein [Liquorilactobacillus capillatus]
MESSQLVAIISRLDAMTENENDEVQTRHFEKNGKEMGIVSFDPTTKTFTLEEVSDKQKFEFDNIDLVAIEVYDLLNE